MRHVSLPVGSVGERLCAAARPDTARATAVVVNASAVRKCIVKTPVGLRNAGLCKATALPTARRWFQTLSVKQKVTSAVKTERRRAYRRRFCSAAATAADLLPR